MTSKVSPKKPQKEAFKSFGALIKVILGALDLVLGPGLNTFAFLLSAIQANFQKYSRGFARKLKKYKDRQTKNDKETRW